MIYLISTKIHKTFVWEMLKLGHFFFILNFYFEIQCLYCTWLYFEKKVYGDAWFHMFRIRISEDNFSFGKYDFGQVSTFLKRRLCELKAISLGYIYMRRMCPKKVQSIVQIARLWLNKLFDNYKSNKKMLFSCTISTSECIWW